MSCGTSACQSLQELHFVGVEDGLRARLVAELRGAARVIEVVVREDDPPHLYVRPLAQELHALLDRGLVAEAAVDERAFAAVRDQEDVRRLRARVEGGRRRDGMDVRRYFHAAPCVILSLRGLGRMPANNINLAPKRFDPAAKNLGGPP